MAEFKTSDQVITALGGPVPISKLLAQPPYKLTVDPNTVSTWRRRGFPVWIRSNMRILCEGDEEAEPPRPKIDAEPELFVVRPPYARRRAA